MQAAAIADTADRAPASGPSTRNARGTALRDSLAALPSSGRLGRAQRLALHRLAYAALATGDLARARRCYEGLVFYGAADAQAWRGLAASAHAQADHPAALTAWTMVSLLDDNASDATFYAARCQAQLGDLAGAQQGFEQVSRDERADATLRSQAAQLLALLQQRPA